MFHAVLFRSTPWQVRPTFVRSLATVEPDDALHVRAGVDMVNDDDLACFIYDDEDDRLRFKPESNVHVDDPEQAQAILAHILDTCRARIR